MRDEFSPEEFALDDDAVSFGGGFENGIDEDEDGAEPTDEEIEGEEGDGLGEDTDPTDEEDL